MIPLGPRPQSLVAESDDRESQEKTIGGTFISVDVGKRKGKSYREIRDIILVGNRRFAPRSHFFLCVSPRLPAKPLPAAPSLPYRASSFCHYRHCRCRLRLSCLGASYRLARPTLRFYTQVVEYTGDDNCCQCRKCLAEGARNEVLEGSDAAA